MHHQKVALYKCGVQGPCNFSSTDVGQVRKHQTKNQQLDTTKFKKPMDMVLNTKHIAPGQARRLKKCSNLNSCGQDEAATSHHALPVLNEIKTCNNVNRDKTIHVRKSTVNP